MSLFRESDIPESLCWISDLSPVNGRLFIVELSDALKASVISGDLSDLLELLDAWEATASLDATPGVLEEVQRPKDYKPLRAFSA